MEPLLIGIIGVAVFLILVALGVHIALALAFTGFTGVLLIVGFTEAAWLTVSSFYFVVAKATFIVIPLFIFMGVLAGYGGIGRNVYKVLTMWSGRIRGAAGIATVASCTAFGVVTGSSLVTASVFSKVAAPEMRRLGYDKRLAYGICASAGAIGMLIPPSVLIVIYSILSGVSTGKLLIAGIAPGLGLAVVFSVGILTIGAIKPALVGGGAPEKATWHQRLVSIRFLWPITLVGLIIVGGIFAGVFDPNEAAAFGALVLVIIIIATTGRERWKVVTTSLLESVTISAMIFFILGGAATFSRFLILSGITPKILEFVIDMFPFPLAFIMVMCLIYLVLGCFLDSISMLSITLPLVIPAANALHIDPIHFGIVVILAIETGLITPPVGLNIYGAKGVAEPDVSLEDIFRGSFPFFFMMLVSLVLFIAFPWLSTILPGLMFGD